MKDVLIATGAFGLMLLILASSVLGQNQVFHTKRCVNDTLMWTYFATMVVQETNTTRTFNISQPQVCPYGCQNDTCMDPPWITYAWIFGIIIIAAVLYLIFRPR